MKFMNTVNYLGMMFLLIFTGIFVKVNFLNSYSAQMQEEV